MLVNTEMQLKMLSAEVFIRLVLICMQIGWIQIRKFLEPKSY